MTPEVQAAIDEVASTCPHERLHVAADHTGGAFLILEGVPLGSPYAQAETWVGFHVTDACPYADVYPHFVRGDLARSDGAALGEGITINHTWPDSSALADAGMMPSRAAAQLSRRSNKRDASGLETPALKLMKVMKWLLSR